MEKEFFEKFGIEPFIKKGEHYFSKGVRFAETVAEEDILWKIDAKKIIELEGIIGTFILTCEPAQQDETQYLYSTKLGSGKFCLDRKDALLSYLIMFSDNYKTLVKTIFRK